MFIAAALLFCYVLLLFWLILRWGNPSQDRKGEKSHLACSVLVPFRNEADNLSTLVESLSRQSHSGFEVLFINDHSTDEGETLLEELLKRSPLEASVLSLSGTSGKKAALNEGIHQSSHDIIVTTDADCTMGAGWLTGLLLPFDDEQVQMVLGPVNLKGQSLWQKMQSLEFSSLMAITSLSASLGKPLMANGANIAYRKAAFEQVNGFQGIDSSPSGDDELLMHKIISHFGGGVLFNRSGNTLVSTEAMPTWSEFRNQRIRWASKWKVGKRQNTMLSALMVLLIQLSQLYVLIQVFVEERFALMGALVLGLKFIAEILLIRQIRKPFSLKTPITIFLLCFILYPFYAIYFGLAANFKKFDWKGRQYAPVSR
ncbi:glycosyltransferase [Roseivirga sp.]|uniref:glycosyltransferase n=1 Tax=Roseivirga sp. TaxID=1964215 RepID=UPI003B517CE7